MLSNLVSHKAKSENDKNVFEYRLEFTSDVVSAKDDLNNYSFSYNQNYQSILHSILDRKLNKDLEIQIINDGKYWFINSDDLCIYESGDTYFEALMSFSSFFISDMDFYKESPDEELTEDAKDLKKKYFSYCS